MSVKVDLVIRISDIEKVCSLDLDLSEDEIEYLLSKDTTLFAVNYINGILFSRKFVSSITDFANGQSSLSEVATDISKSVDFISNNEKFNLKGGEDNA